MREIALHLLDIAQNSAEAHARTIVIKVHEDTKTDLLQLSVQDDGCGMDAQTAMKVMDPFYTSRTTRKVGLGIPLFKEAAEACNGFLKIDTKPGGGTQVDIQFQRSHIDRMPLGDLASTFFDLLVGYPNIHFIFEYSMDNKEFLCDDTPIKAELAGVSLTEPSVLGFLREYLDSGIDHVQSTSNSAKANRKNE